MKRDFWDWGVLVAQLVAGVGAGVAAVFAWRAAVATKDSTEAAVQSASAAERSAKAAQETAAATKEVAGELRVARQAEADRRTAGQLRAMHDLITGTSRENLGGAFWRVLGKNMTRLGQMLAMVDVRLPEVQRVLDAHQDWKAAGDAPHPDARVAFRAALAELEEMIKLFEGPPPPPQDE